MISSESAGPLETVMVIDRDPMFRQLLDDVLRDAGLEPCMMPNAAQALVALQSVMPKLIILDLTLPGEEAWDFLKRRSTDSRLTSVPVLALSNPVQMRNRGRDLDTQVAAVLNKPVALGRLMRAVAEYVTVATES